MSSDSPAPTNSKWMLWGGYAMSALPSLMLFFSAGMKLSNSAMVVEGFSKMGYPVHLTLGIGAVELVSTILYLIPRTSVLGAILLTGYLGGATATHVRLGEPFIGPVLFGVLIWGGLYLRDARIRALIPLKG
jgi:hypothetical protein